MLRSSLELADIFRLHGPAYGGLTRFPCISTN